MSATASLTLFTATAVELLELLQFREDLAADPDVQPDELAESLKACDQRIEAYIRTQVEQADGVAAYLRECEAREAALKIEATRIRDRAALWAQRRDQVEQVVQRVMQSLGKKKIEGGSSTLALRKNPPSTEIRQPDLVPASYRRVTVTMGERLYSELLNILARYPDTATLLAELMTCKRTEPEVSKSKVLAELKAGGSVPGAVLVTDKTHLEVK